MIYTYKDTLKACYIGYITQAIINNLAPILFIIFQTEYNISFEEIGRLILINFMTQIIVDIIAVKYVDKIGYRKPILLAHVCCVVGLIGLVIFPIIMPTPYVGLIIAVIIYAIGGGLIEVLISPIVEALPGDAKASAMSLLHSFYCWGQMGVVLVTTLLLKIIGQKIWIILPIMWALVPLFNAFIFIKVPLAPTVKEDKQMSVKELLNSKFFIIALMLMLCAGASELTMSQWSSLFAEKGLMVPKVIGDLAGPCMFALFMGIGRTLYGIWGHKIKLDKTLFASGILCVICYLTTVFSPYAIISLIACGMCGLSVSLMWPGTFSLVSEKFPFGGTAMFGLLAVFGDIGCSIGPWLAGVISDNIHKITLIVDIAQNRGLSIEQIGLKSGLLIGTIFPIALILGIISFKKYKISKASLS